MKKFRMFLCLVVVLLSMAACGNNDIQAQTPVNQAEPLMAERTSLSEASEESENEAISSEDVDATETETEKMPENTISDRTESMADLAADASEEETAPETIGAETDTRNGVEEETVMNMNVQVGDAVFSATLEQNEAVNAFVEMMREDSVVIQMSDYSGFEKVGPLGTSLPASNSQTTTHAGDIVLYNGNQIVIFYGSNSWSYTRLGHIDDLTGWEEALGNGDVTVIFSLE